VGVLVPAILAHPGPVVSTSIKEDVYDATAIARTRMGRLWHFNPDGGELLPGCTPLRWSPIPASRDWSAAIALASSMTDVVESGGEDKNSSFFRIKAAVLIVPPLHAAALEDKPMTWMLRAVANHRKTIEEVQEILDANAKLTAEAAIAAGELEGIRDPPRHPRWGLCHGG
jgi:type IV secretion system protein VirD4